jgi:Fe-S cluster assembly ATPase SufC
VLYARKVFAVKKAFVIMAMSRDDGCDLASHERSDASRAPPAKQALAALLTGRTIITVAHRLQTARDADRVAIMSGGQVVEIGSHEELLRNDGPYAALWRAWQGEADGSGSR